MMMQNLYELSISIMRVRDDGEILVTISLSAKDDSYMKDERVVIILYELMHMEIIRVQSEYR